MSARFVMVSGIPASGKSTLGRQLADAVGLPTLDKDDILESLFDREVVAVDSARRDQLSRSADDEFERLALASEGGSVLVSFWRRPELSSTSGTPTDWLRDLDGVVEVHCRCSPITAARRFAARRRHRAHGDDSKSLDQLSATFAALAALGPLGISPGFTVDTEQPVSPEQLAAIVTLIAGDR